MGRAGALVALLGLLAPLADAAGSGELSVELAGAHLRSITADGVTVPRHALLLGRSTGAVAPDPSGLPARAADDFDLATYFGRDGVADPAWRVELGAWRDTNGPAPDFFVLEAGGNDVLAVSPLFPDGTVGERVHASGWSPVGYTVPHGPNAGQAVHGLAISAAELRDVAGAPLAPDAVLAGLVLWSPGVDGAVLAAVHPDPPPAPGGDGDGSLTLSPAPTVWQPLELTLQGPFASELDDAPNPFLDHRLDVTFTGPGGRTWRVPGFFDADGAGGDAGRVWRARFAPDLPGSWSARVSFRSGPDVAVELAETAGTPLAPYDGRALAFEVAPRDPAAPGFLRWGRLEYVRDHYRKFRDGPWFLKGGTNSPENLFAYRGFDGIRDAGGIGVLHRYAAHAHLWQPGDPLFESDCTGEDSKGIVGALRYLAQEGVNSVYFLPMNLGGDGQDTAPFVGYANTEFDKTHYDTSRLAQWAEVLDLSQRLGISVQLVLSETEPANEQWLDAGLLGRERKLFFRELVARFSHLLALKWNLAEENDFGVGELRDQADWLRALDPYDHPIGFHNHPDDFTDYDAVAGETRFEAVSLQYSPQLAGAQAEAIRAASAAAGRRWLAELDENTPWDVGLTDTNAAELRKTVLWDVYLSGGQLEWYLGWHDLPLGGDLTVEDLSTRAEMWRYTRHARRFLAQLPFPTMEPADGLMSGAAPDRGGPEVFARRGVVYAVYLPAASPSGTLDLTGARGRYVQRWYDPRTGRYVGTPRLVDGGGPLPLGAPPAAPDEDWACLLWRDDLVPRAERGL